MSSGDNMVTLNDYLYSGDTVLRILKKYMEDLRISAVQEHNEVDLVHCNFLLQIMELLEHNDFLTAQSQKIREFYKYMAQEYYKCNFDILYLIRNYDDDTIIQNVDNKYIFTF